MNIRGYPRLAAMCATRLAVIITLILALILITLLGILPLAPAFAMPAGSRAIVDSDGSVTDSDRSIYVGDIVALEIRAPGLSQEDLREAFSAFEILDLSAKNGIYHIFLRSFEPGEYRALFGDKELVITVRSTLEDIERDTVYEGAWRSGKPGFVFHWRALFYLCAGMFALSAASVAMFAFLKKKVKPVSPYQLFLRQSAALRAQEENYLVDLTRLLKEYLGSLYQRRIIGKTTFEIVSELKETPMPDDALSDIGSWLSECDRMKFSGAIVSASRKEAHYAKLLELAGTINSLGDTRAVDRGEWKTQAEEKSA